MKLAVIASLTLACYMALSPLTDHASSKEKVTFNDSLKAALQAKVGAIFARSCATSGCHSGKFPKMKLNMESASLVESLRNAPSRQIDTLKLVDTKRPEASYLIMKIRGDKGIHGDRMPLDAEPLKTEETHTAELWVYSMAVFDTIKAKEPPRGDAKEKSPTPRSETNDAGFEAPPFFGKTLINLPTTEPLGKGETLFRISHRYRNATNTGYDAFYGADGPAFIFLSLAYGITDRWDVTLGRTNLLHEVDLSTSYAAIEQGNDFGMPFSANVTAGASLTTETPAGSKVFTSGNLHLSAQLSLSRQFTNRLTALCVPSLSYNTDYAHPEDESTFALGLGGRFMFIENASIIGEWIPVVSGFSTDRDSWSLGLEAKKGGHVFQLFVSNVFGLTSNQYLPGGDLRISDGDVRLGFNIYRIL